MKFKIILLLSLACSIPIQSMENHDDLLDTVTDEFLAGLPQQDVLTSALDGIGSDDPPLLLPQSLVSASSSDSEDYQDVLDPEEQQASSSALQPAPALSEYFDQKEIDEALAAVSSISPDEILQEVEAETAKTAKEALAEGLKRFKSQQEVLWSTKPITYNYTVDESVYEWVECENYHVDERYKNGYGWIYRVPLDIHQPDGTIVTKMIDSDENPTIYERDTTYSWRKKTIYRKRVCRDPKIITKEAEIPLRFGVYRRDIADAALLAGNVAAEYCFNKYITSLRVSRIVSHILANIDDTEHFLQQIVNELATAEKEYYASIKGKGFLERSKLRAVYLLEIPKIKEIFKTYTDRIAGTSSNPFNPNFFMNMENLPVIVGRLLLNRATDYLEKKYVMPDYQHVLKESAFAYKQNENGELVSDGIPPVSMVMIAKAIIHPKLFCQSIQRNLQAGGAGFVKAFTGGMELPSIDGMQLMSKLAGLPIPEWVFSDRVKSAAALATEVCIEGLSMKFFNDYCAQQWVEFLGANHQELITLISKYKQAKEQNPYNEEELKKAEKAIRDFVQTGHDPSWFFPAKYWYMRFLTDYTTKNKVKNYILGSALGIAAWKAWSWWRSSTSVKQ